MELTYGGKMKKAKPEEEVIATEIPPQELDKSVVEMITALKNAGSLYAIGSLKNVKLTIELNELLLFVGISSRQAGNRILFAWTEAIKNNKGWPDETN